MQLPLTIRQPQHDTESNMYLGEQKMSKVK
jgi:hypothetical protein